jgi:hypothetical protein
MKWVLTLYVCSVLSGECVTPKQEHFSYKTEYGTHYGCVRAGLGDSFELMFNGESLSANQIETYKLYPKFTCITEKENKEDT